MRTEKYSSTPLLFSMISFPPELINIENRGAFFKKLSGLLQINNIHETKGLDDFKNITLSNNECIYVIDFRQNKLLFSKGFQDILGYKDKEITIELIRQLYHPNDFEITTKVYKATLLYSLNHPEDSASSTLFISFRIRKKNGSYIKILSRSTILEMDENGRVISSLVKFTNISFIDKTDNVNWEFKTKNLMKDFFKEEVYRAYQDFFTKRETGVIIQMEKGLSNKDIAKKLSISEHTVATHRKNILRKAKCHHSEELIIFCKGKGIL